MRAAFLSLWPSFKNVLAVSTVGLALLAFPGFTQAQYSFSYNFTTTSGNINSSGLYSGAAISPWVFNSVLANGTTAVNGQIRLRNDEGMRNVGAGAGEDVGLTIKSRVTTAGAFAGNGTMIYYGNTSGTSAVPMVMNLSSVGSTFTMTMGYAPNPATTGIHDGGANVSDVGSQLMKMGMVYSATSGGAATLGVSDSLFVDYHEISGVAGQLGSTTGYYEVRTLNSGTSVATGKTQISPGTVTLQAANSTTHYNYYVYDTTYTNVGYDLGGEALFNVVMNVQAYSVERGTGVTTLLGGSTAYSANNVATDLNATELATMYVAMGYTYPNATQISVTGTTYDYFSTNITNIPEPTAVGLLGLAAMALLPRRRSRKAARG